MFDQREEDKDTANQVKKSTPDTSDVDSTRSEREGTPAPQSASEESKQHDPSATSHAGEPEYKAVVDDSPEKKGV